MAANQKGWYIQYLAEQNLDLRLAGEERFDLEERFLKNVSSANRQNVG